MSGSILFVLAFCALVSPMGVSAQPDTLLLSQVEIELDWDMGIGAWGIITIYGDGRVTYDVPGLRRKKETHSIDKEFVVRLVRDFYRHRFFEMDDKYMDVSVPSLCADGDTLLIKKKSVLHGSKRITTFRAGPFEKKVYNYDDNAPLGLLYIEKQIMLLWDIHKDD